MQKDYYAILGVSSAASQEEIKMAFERLSLEKKREAEEAYLILSNPHSRYQYDRIYNTLNLTRSFDGFDGSKIVQGSLIGHPSAEVDMGVEPLSRLDIDLEDPEGMLPDDFAEIFQAAIKNIVNATNQLKNIPSQEEGFKNGGDIFLDLAVNEKEAVKGGYIPLEYQRFIFCSQCQEKDFIKAKNCAKCDGAGRVIAHRRVEIKVPKDTKMGSVLRVASEGHAPSAGSGQVQSGDLFVKIIIREDV